MGIVVSSSEVAARLVVTTAHSGLEITVTDSSFAQLAHGVGGLDAQLRAGIYELRFRSGPFEQTRLIKLQAGAVHTEPAPEIAFPSPAPLEGTTTTHEYHQQAAIDASRMLTYREGNAGLVTMVRNVAGQDDLPFSPETIEPLGLVAPTLDEIVGWRNEWTLDRAQSDKWAAWSGFLEPGGYALRRRTPAGAIDQAVWLSEGWQTLVFVPNTPSGPAPELATVHMARLGEEWLPWQGTEIGLALEAVLWGLRSGRPVVPRDLDRLLHAKFENPFLGIVGAHAMLLEEQPDLRLLAIVLGNLEALVPGHPDVVALAYLAHDAGVQATSYGSSVEWPPLLLASYTALLRADAFEPGVIVDGSAAERAAARLVTRGLWTAWMSLDLGVGDADPGTARLEAYVRGAAQVRRVEPAKILATPVRNLSLATGLPTVVVRRAVDSLKETI